MKKLILPLAAILFVTNLFTASGQITWEQLNGPFGGSVRIISQNKNHDIIAIANNNAYKTTNQGLNWSYLKNDSFSPVEYFYFDDVVFGISISDSKGHNMVYSSADNMQSWTKKSTGLQKLFINKIKKLGDNYYACSDSGVYKSLNNGDSWELAYYVPNLQMNFIYDIVVNSKNMIFLSTVAGLYRSKDNGTTWTLMNPYNTKMKSNIENILLTDDEKIFINTPMGMFSSFDDGDTWAQIGTGIIEANLSFIMSPKPGELLVSKTWGGMCSSTDFGNTWKQINDQSVYQMVMTSDGKILAGSLDGVLFADSLTGSWTLRNEGISELSISYVYVNKSNNTHRDEIIAGSHNAGIFKSTDGGLSWKTVHQMNGSEITSIIAGQNDMLFASSVWGGVARSSDYGETWVSVNEGLDDPDIRTLAVDNNGHIYAGAFSVIYKSTNNGDSWTVCLSQNQSVQCNSIIVTSDNMIFAGTLVYGVLKSTNGGTVWKQMANGLAVPVDNLAVNKNDEIFATSNTGSLYITTNDGSNWSLVKANESVICMFFLTDSDILAGVDQNHVVVGIQRSTNKGQTWVDQDTGAEDQYVYSFASNSKGEIFAGSSRGIYKSPEHAVSVDDEVVNVADIRIFPNPASNNICINLPEIDLSSATIIISNYLGFELKRFGGSDLIGNKSINLLVDEFPSGFYYCSILVNGKHITKPFVISR